MAIALATDLLTRGPGFPCSSDFADGYSVCAQEMLAGLTGKGQGAKQQLTCGRCKQPIDGSVWSDGEEYCGGCTEAIARWATRSMDELKLAYRPTAQPIDATLSLPCPHCRRVNCVQMVVAADGSIGQPKPMPKCETCGKGLA